MQCSKCSDLELWSPTWATWARIPFSLTSCVTLLFLQASLTCVKGMIS
jgi:hypothetical protein